MVIAPPLADLRYPPIRWQTVFVSTAPLVGKSVQNGDQCGICATVWPQLSRFRFIMARLFRNTSRRIGISATLAAVSGERIEPRGRCRVRVVAAFRDFRLVQRAVKPRRRL